MGEGFAVKGGDVVDEDGIVETDFSKRKPIMAFELSELCKVFYTQEPTFVSSIFGIFGTTTTDSEMTESTCCYRRKCPKAEEGFHLVGYGGCKGEAVETIKMSV